MRRLRLISLFILKFCLFVALCGALFGILGGIPIYAAYSRTIPSMETIANWQTDEATRIYDRNGQLLYEVYGEKNRIVVPSDKIAPTLKQATVAIEDARFYQHHGLDFRGIARALLRNYQQKDTTEGGSTITQQLAKNSYLSSERTLNRKIKEAILALKIERHYTKDQILTMYLNEVGYGGNAYGAEAASKMYFGKSAKDLNLQESATLAALTKAPSLFSPYSGDKNALLARRDIVLGRMATQSYITAEERDKAKQTTLVVQAPKQEINAPHFVMEVKKQLIDKYGEDAVQKGGFEVTTTLDLTKQRLAESIISQSGNHLKSAGASNAALVALDPKTGEILTMVGSRNYFDSQHNGNFNVITANRPPGSAFKPVVYAIAFEKGLLAPGSTLFDLKTDFGDKVAYIPQNYDKKYHGPVSVRTALANSYNAPAVKAMALIGEKETLEAAKNMGITTFTDPQKYGLSLVLGGGDVRPLELANAYGALANQGKVNAPTTILKITQHGKTLFEYKPEQKLVVRSETAAEVTSILADKEARKPIFGTGGPLELKDRPVAAKTGTTEDYRDAWTVGYTPSLVTAVWVGNNDFSPMKEGSAGAMAAAPLWNSFMTQALSGTPAEQFELPSTLKMVKVDAITGKLPNPSTRETREDLFAAWQMPSDIQLASFKVIGCDGNTHEEHTSAVIHSEKPDNPKWEKPVVEWARSHGYATGTGQARTETCTTPTPEPVQVAEDTNPNPVGGSNETPPEGVAPPLAVPAPTPLASPPQPVITPPEIIFTPFPMPTPFIPPGQLKKME